MKIKSIERLDKNHFHSIWVCVEWETNPEQDDEYMEDMAGKLILDYVNSYPSDYFHIKEGENFDSKYTADKYSEALYLSYCSKNPNSEHWSLE